MIPTSDGGGDDRPLLIVLLDLFRDSRPRTLRQVAETLNTSEEAALSALERLESGDVLVRARGGTGTPVWMLRADGDARIPLR